MAGNLYYEFSKFQKYCRELQQILTNTKLCFAEIERSGYFNDSELDAFGLSLENKELVEGIIHKPLGILILGDSCYAKAGVVNELFGQSLLPTAHHGGDAEEENINWRMIKFTYGNQTEISLALSDSVELISHFTAQQKPLQRIAPSELEIRNENQNNLTNNPVEIKLRHSLLQENVHVIVSPSYDHDDFEQVVQQCISGVTPIFIYCYKDEALSEKEVVDLLRFKKLAPMDPVFFVCSKPSPTCELTESEQHARKAQSSSHRRCRRYSCQEYYTSHHFQNGRRRGESVGSRFYNAPLSVYQQLCALGFLNPLPPRARIKTYKSYSDGDELQSELVENFENFPSILLFVRHILQFLLVKANSLLNEAHNNCLRTFILSAFDMTRDLLITPKRLEYARKQESELYLSLIAVASKKQEEIRGLIVATVCEMKEVLIQQAFNWEFQSLCTCETEKVSNQNLQICTTEIQQFILDSLNRAIVEKLVGSLSCLQDSYIGTLERCLVSLEKLYQDESSCLASSSLRQILNAAYQVDVTFNASASLLHVVLSKMKQNASWKITPKIDCEWKKCVARVLLDSISETRLARSICYHFCERVKKSHNQFLTAIQKLEELHLGRLQYTEEQKLKVRKTFAPKMARCALESNSLMDVVLFGMPKLTREIGRGQFGVVYSCEGWGGLTSCAVKSVVPPDDKQWNDLAMEFFYTRSIPDHERVVQIKGSVIDHFYGDGSSPAVLLIMKRLQLDLYSALKSGLDIVTRLQIAVDAVEGIRFLHSQGLIHRDIKLKNVLLDAANRAKLTDLGFCKPKAMMSGSIVGTPIHMAPELFTGHYDSSVDVYAFGILFWYLCAGDIKMPHIFEQCQTKDRLFHCVMRGGRPEKLPHFSEDCWRLMSECWATEPKNRPLLGEVEPRLKVIMESYRTNPQSSGSKNGPKQVPQQRRTIITMPVVYSELIRNEGVV
ncbi:dual serine/threonine and tyrosine protein kinase-like isoform X2 [Tachypleus tridentatus]|uniref:dual serine/threonine and tyrosine protein kinase-like isoform X2 n=1 Tax=Tachypleus tridentatus TaxID=6853 RepID=UPI003FD597FD